MEAKRKATMAERRHMAAVASLGCIVDTLEGNPGVPAETGRAAPAFNIPQTLPEALRLAADLADRNAALTAVVAEQAPKVEALDRISTADGSLCIRDTAKALQVRPIDLTRWLQGHGWIYRRAGNGSWLGYQDKVQIGYLEHKVTTVSRSDGSDKVVEQVRVTPKGLTKLAQAIRADLAVMERVAA